jgi:hypothetical protein
MKKLKESVSFKPVYKNTIFDNETDCKWAIYFEALGFKWAYKPDWETKTIEDHGDAEHPTFKVKHTNWGDYVRWFYVVENIEHLYSRLYNDLLDQIEISNTPVIILDGPPRLGAFLELSLEFSTLRGRSEGFLDGLALATKARKRDGSVLHPCRVNVPYTEGYFFEDPGSKRMARDIKKAVKAADKLFLNAVTKLGAAS